MGKKSATKRVVANPASAFAAQVFAVAPKAAAKEREAWRVPCLFGACSATFLPHGVGAAMHGNCPEGLAVMRAVRAAKDAGEEAAALKRVAELIEAAKAK